MTVRRPAVAGSFYPADADTLRAAISDAITHAVAPPVDAPAPKALVVPHAGYVYSGPIAASAYLRLKPAVGRIRRVLLLGPSHRVYHRGLAAPAVDAFSTPLGDISIDAELRTIVVERHGVAVDDEPHRAEHSLEVQLPFLQSLLDEFTLLPLTVGDATGDAVAAVLDSVWGGAETLVVISTDLSHYHDHTTATALDAATAAAIVAADAAAIGDRAACGHGPSVACWGRGTT